MVGTFLGIPEKCFNRVASVSSYEGQPSSPACEVCPFSQENLTVRMKTKETAQFVAVSQTICSLPVPRRIPVELPRPFGEAGLVSSHLVWYTIGINFPTCRAVCLFVVGVSHHTAKPPENLGTHTTGAQ